MRGRRRQTTVVIAIAMVGVAVGAILGGTRTSPASAGSGSAAATANRQCEPKTVKPPATMTDQYDRKVLSLDPSLYLALGNLSSAVEPDLSGNKHNGAYEPDTRRPQFAILPNGDLATNFNGNDEYVQVSSSESLSVTDTGCLTVEAWIRPSVLQFPHNQGSGYVYILGKGVTGKQEYAIRMYSYRNSEVPARPNRISAYMFNLDGGKGSGAYFQDKVSPGDWVMITFVVDSRSSAKWPDGYIVIYENGKVRGPRVSLGQFSVTPRSSNAPFRIATRDLESFFEGAIGKVAVYNSLLSAQDISETYEAMMPHQA
jgi:hypothetical protein